MTGVEFLELAMKNYPDSKRALLTVYADTKATIKSINKAKIAFYLMEPWIHPEKICIRYIANAYYQYSTILLNG
jgi:thioredoxin reductase (NADPH)